MSYLRFLAAGASLLIQIGNVSGNVLDPEAWPRTYQLPEAEIAIYMPQIVEWRGYLHLRANVAIGVKLKGSADVCFGTSAIDADTVTDFDEGQVRLGNRSFSGFRFPELDTAAAAKAEELVRSILRPDSPLELPLASVTAALERSQNSSTATAVSFEPPPIFFSDSPAVLVTFIGQPRFEAVVSGSPLMFAINTNWDILFDGSRYYLLAGNQWLATDNLLKGTWAAATSLPAAFNTLPDDGNWSEVKSKLFVLPSSAPPVRVITSDRPSEMILTEGKPQLAPIPQTSLMYAVNTENDLFFRPEGKTWYLLVSGRWFSSTSLDGSWKAASDSLPPDFADIPPDHPKGDVRVSVKGTSEAEEAVIQSSIPQTATVRRAGTTIKVTYEGEPKFKTIPGAQGVEFALNTSSDVFRVAGAYYCCYQGVWFQSFTPSGSWIVCDKLPGAIDTIPPQSPKYNVTHVHIYDSDAESVKVGVTAGYYGAYVSKGLVVFGLGMWLAHEMAEDDCWSPHYYPVPLWYGYGCGAVYLPGKGYYRRGAACYGPYGGAGYGAGYNPATGGYFRGAYAYGPYRSAGVRAAYNPWTDTAAGRASVSTPYGSWGRSAVMRDDEWIRAGHRSTPSGTLAGIQTSQGGAAVGINRTFGPDGFIGKNADGDIYVGKDGNIYRKNEGEEWQKREKGGWQDTSPSKPNPPPRPNPPSNPSPPSSPRDPKPTTLPARTPNLPPATREVENKGGFRQDPTSSQLERDSDARKRSNRGSDSDRRAQRRR